MLVNGDRGWWTFLWQVTSPCERLWRRRRAP
jgi:hypothetical protein